MFTGIWGNGVFDQDMSPSCETTIYLNTHSINTKCVSVWILHMINARLIQTRIWWVETYQACPCWRAGGGVGRLAVPTVGVVCVDLPALPAVPRHMRRQLCAGGPPAQRHGVGGRGPGLWSFHEMCSGGWPLGMPNFYTFSEILLGIMGCCVRGVLCLKISVICQTIKLVSTLLCFGNQYMQVKNIFITKWKIFLCARAGSILSCNSFLRWRNGHSHHAALHLSLFVTYTCHLQILTLFIRFPWSLVVSIVNGCYF